MSYLMTPEQLHELHAGLVREAQAEHLAVAILRERRVPLAVRLRDIGRYTRRPVRALVRLAYGGDAGATTVRTPHRSAQ